MSTNNTEEQLQDQVEERVEAALAQPPVQASAELLEMFRAMLSAQSEANREMFLAGIAEMKKPDAETAAKIEQEKERSMQLTMRRIESAKKEERERGLKQATCTHTKPNGKTNLTGQVNSNGYATVYCSYCQVLSAPFAAMPHELTGGLNVGGWGDQAWRIVQNRVKQSPTPPPVPDIPFGATILF